MKREPFGLSVVALAISLLTFLLPCSSPLGIALGIAALCKSRGPLGKGLAVAAVAVAGLNVVLALVSVLGLLGLQGALLGCSLCSNSGY